MSEYIDYIDWGNINEESTRPHFSGELFNLHDENSYHVITSLKFYRAMVANATLTLL